MTATRIDREDIRVGDVIEVRETLTVTDVAESWRGTETDIRYAEFPNRMFSLKDEAQVFLVSRGPSLPTKLGSVVIVNPDGFLPGTWLLTTQGWVSATGKRFNDEEFRRFLERNAFTFKVVN